MAMQLKWPDNHREVSELAVTLRPESAPLIRLLLPGGPVEVPIGTEADLKWEGGAATLVVTGAYHDGAMSTEIRGLAMRQKTIERLTEPGVRAAKRKMLILQRRRGQGDGAWLQALTGGLAGRDHRRADVAAVAGEMIPEVGALVRLSSLGRLAAAIWGLRAIQQLGGARIAWRLVDDRSGQPLRLWSAGAAGYLPAAAKPDRNVFGHPLGAADALRSFEHHAPAPPAHFWTGLLNDGPYPQACAGEIGRASWNGMILGIKSVALCQRGSSDLQCRYEVSPGAAIFEEEAAAGLRPVVLEGHLGDWVDRPAGLVSVTPADDSWSLLDSEGTGVCDHGLMAFLAMPAFGAGGDRRGLYVEPKTGLPCLVLLVPGTTPLVLGSVQAATDIEALSGLVGQDARIAGILKVEPGKIVVAGNADIRGDIELKG